MTKFPSVDDLYDLPAKARDRITERAGFFIVDPAAGQAVTSASASIQSKIGKAAAFGGGVVLIPPGVYPIGSTLTVPSNVTIQGAGRGATILRNMVEANTPVIHSAAVGTLNVTLRDMTVDGNRTFQSGAGFSTIRVYSGTEWVFHNLEVMGAHRLEPFPSTQGGGEAIELVKGGKHKITDCYVHDTGYDGVKLRTSHYNIITNLHAHNCGKSGVQISYAYEYAELGQQDLYPSERNVIAGLVVTHESGTPGDGSPSTVGVTFHCAADNVITGMVVDGPQNVFNDAGLNGRNIVSGLDARVRTSGASLSAVLGDLGRAFVTHGFSRASDGSYTSPILTQFGTGWLRQEGSHLVWRVGGVDQNLSV